MPNQPEKSTSSAKGTTRVATLGVVNWGKSNLKSFFFPSSVKSPALSSMATASLSLTNFLSFLSLSKASALPSLSSSVQLPSQSIRCAWAPVVARPPPSSADYSPVTSPALMNANILFFNSPYNVEIIVDDDEPEDSLLSRFRREVFRARVIQEAKRRRFFESTQEYRKRKSREAAKKNRKWRPRVNNEKQSEQENPKKKKKGELDEEEDNWEWDIPEEDIPYCSNFK